MFVLHIKVYATDKTWCDYAHNQTADYAVNPGLIMSKASVNNGYFNMEQQQTTGRVDKGCHQFQ